MSKEPQVPEWAKGEGWRYVRDMSCAYHTSGTKIGVRLNGTGYVSLNGDALVEYATPEKARQVADAILDGLL